MTHRISYCENFAIRPEPGFELRLSGCTMFHHPEGSSHPKAPTHLKKAKRYNFGEFVSDRALQTAENFLFSQEFRSSDQSSAASRIREFIYHGEQRSRYVEMAMNDLKNKTPNLTQKYDLVLVGAGIHAAIYIYTLKKLNPHLKVLVVEKETTVCSTLSRLGDALVLNSPTFSKVGLNSNIVQGHFIQLSDFDELAEKPFPTGKHIYEMTAMLFFHADADIVFDFSVDKFEQTSTGIQAISSSAVVEAQKIIISNGMGACNKQNFQKDQTSEKLISGDHFIARCYQEKDFLNSLKDKKVAVIGDGDTANCAMEYLLPLVYPNYYYGFYRKSPTFPKSIFWIGQNAADIRQYFFANKSRYCHSGGVCEFFWDGESPFELSTEIWKKTRNLVQCVPDKLVSLTHQKEQLELTIENDEVLNVDFVVDCTCRSNPLSSNYLQQGTEFIHGDIVLYGGQWVEELERYEVTPRQMRARKIAMKVKNKNLYLIGGACPLDELIDSSEAKDGSLKYLDARLSLTNSKWSMEHTLPRTVALAELHAQMIN